MGLPWARSNAFWGKPEAAVAGAIIHTATSLAVVASPLFSSLPR